MRFVSRFGNPVPFDRRGIRSGTVATAATCVRVIATALLVCGCAEDKRERPTPFLPLPTALDALEASADVQAPECFRDSDCDDRLETKECRVSACVDGACGYIDAPVGTRCEGPAADSECAWSVCAKEADGTTTCSAWKSAPDGYPCGASYAACGTAAMCSMGLCTDPCDDANPCTSDKCTKKGCKFEPDDKATCDDGIFCTENDRCENAACVGDKVCDCQVDADCLPMEDGDLCNGTLECKNGLCKIDPATVVKCVPDPESQCTENTCDAQKGICAPAPKPDDTPCDDGVPCTDQDACHNGKCKGVPAEDCEGDCDNFQDDDGDGPPDCWDQDCKTAPECLDGWCGDSICEEGENCKNCPPDCSEGCEIICGDGLCHAGECETCPPDCDCTGKCNDGVCNKNENCKKCPADCGECLPVCGDNDCHEQETCTTCPLDCGVCPVVCGNMKCEMPTESCSNCPDCICEVMETCIDGECCQPYCVDMECGEDGCGSQCGVCPPGFDCVNFVCDCSHDCTDKECGDDGCGGSCGTCDAGYECQDGICEAL